jgi:hypothetical protein
MGKIKIGVKRFANLFMISEFRAIVSSYSHHPIYIGFKPIYCYLCNQFRGFIVNDFKNRFFRNSLYDNYDGPFTLLAYDRINFPIPYPVYNGMSFIKEPTIFNRALLLRTAITFAIFFTLMAQINVEFTASLFIL